MDSENKEKDLTDSSTEEPSQVADDDKGIQAPDSLGNEDYDEEENPPPGAPPFVDAGVAGQAQSSEEVEDDDDDNETINNTEDYDENAPPGALLELGVAAAVFGGLSALSSGGAVAAAHVATGPNRQPGDKTRLILAAVKIGREKGIQRYLSQSDVFTLLFSQSKYYEGKVATWLETIQTNYPQYPFITPRNMINNMVMDWNKDKLQFDVFDGFGTPGHRAVHAGLMFVYNTAAAAADDDDDGKDLWAGLTIDLKTGSNNMSFLSEGENQSEFSKVILIQFSSDFSLGSSEHVNSQDDCGQRCQHIRDGWMASQDNCGDDF